MKKITMLLLTLLFTNAALATFPAPWPNQTVYDADVAIKARATTLETANTATTEGLINKKHARFVWNYTDTTTKTTIKQAIESFLLSCKVEGKSYGTIECYSDKFKGFLWYAS